MEKSKKDKNENLYFLIKTVLAGVFIFYLAFIVHIVLFFIAF